MNPDRYHHNCTILGISPNSSWQEIRRHYKRLAGAWHPDRHHHPSSGHDSAEKKFKEITAAFREISVYYRSHHQPPVQNSTLDENTPREGTQTPTRTEAEPGFSVGAEHEVRFPATTRPRRSRTVIALFVAWGLIAANLLWHEFHTPEDLQPQPPSERNSATLSSGISRQNTPEEYFTIGSTVGEVYSIQGVPTRTVGNVWYYGKSKILFGSGRVVDWEHDPYAPLLARIENPRR